MSCAFIATISAFRCAVVHEVRSTKFVSAVPDVHRIPENVLAKIERVTKSGGPIRWHCASKYEPFQLLVAPPIYLNPRGKINPRGLKF